MLYFILMAILCMVSLSMCYVVTVLIIFIYVLESVGEVVYVVLRMYVHRLTCDAYACFIVCVDVVLDLRE